MPVDLRERLEQDASVMTRALTDQRLNAMSYIRALELFASNPENMPADERPSPMTAREWRNLELESAVGDSDSDTEEEDDEDEGDDFVDEEDADESGDETRTTTGSLPGESTEMPGEKRRRLQ